MKLTMSGTSCSVTVVISRFVARAIERSLGVGADCIDITVVGVECTFIHIWNLKRIQLCLCHWTQKNTFTVKTTICAQKRKGKKVKKRRSKDRGKKERKSERKKKGRGQGRVSRFSSEWIATLRWNKSYSDIICYIERELGIVIGYTWTLIRTSQSFCKLHCFL